MKNPKHKPNSALSEKEGVSDAEILNQKSADTIKKKRQQQRSIQNLIEGIKKGDVASLSQGITLIESTNPEHAKSAQDLISSCLSDSSSLRIGVTGVPGVGKSTFIEALGLYLIKENKKVAVLAVDPSSTVSKGSILGDKTRMEELVKSEDAFIRPSPSGNSLGGVARKTRESIILCEAAGYDTIIIETVGVGQSETAVHSMVDFFLLLKLAGAGDELQGIKRGIIEMADAIVINKADGDNLKAAKSAKLEFQRALHLYPAKASGWTPKTTLCSALKHEGISEIWDMIQNYIKETKASGYFKGHRHEQNKFWLLQTIEERLKSDFFDTPKIKEALKEQLDKIEKGETTPFVAAEYLLQLQK